MHSVSRHVQQQQQSPPRLLFIVLVQASSLEKYILVLRTAYIQFKSGVRFSLAAAANHHF